MSLDTDLFGEAMPTVAHTGAYAGHPGAGPAGKCCRDCAHYCRTRSGSSHVYRKCALIKHRWTNGAGTDIKAGTPACEYFEARSA